MICYIVGVLGILLALALKFYPVGEVYGRKVVLGELFNPNTRLQLSMGRARAILEECRKAPANQRFRTLLGVEEHYGHVFVMGDEIRKAIVATGVSEATSHFQRILQTLHGATYLTSGIREALQSNSAEDDYKVKAFQFLVDGLDHQEFLGVCQEKLPRLLLQLDQAWATRLLRSPEYLNPAHKLFCETLEALSEAGELPPREEIAKWLIHYQGRELNRSEGLAFIEVLKALHPHDHALAEQLLGNEMRGETALAEEAAQALLQIYDLPHPRFSLNDLENKVGIAALNPAERTVRLVDHYNYLMNHTYLHELGSDERGDQMKEMSDALQEVGACNHSIRLAAYMALFGPEGPPSTPADRMAIIEKAGSSWESAVEKITAQHDRFEHAELLVLRFEIDHGDQFRKRSEIQKILEG